MSAFSFMAALKTIFTATWSSEWPPEKETLIKACFSKRFSTFLTWILNNRFLINLIYPTVLEEKNNGRKIKLYGRVTGNPRTKVFHWHFSYFRFKHFSSNIKFGFLKFGQRRIREMILSGCSDRLSWLTKTNASDDLHSLSCTLERGEMRNRR